MKHGVAPLLLLALAIGVEAHQDRRLTLSPDGAMPELPAPYDTTRLHVDFSGPGASPLAMVSLSVPGHALRLPPCLLAQIPAASKATTELTGSWYHDLARMPPYVQVRIHPASARRNRAGDESVELLFSLRDATLLSAMRYALVGEDTIQPRSLDTACR
jgi:hypothetical protein